MTKLYAAQSANWEEVLALMAQPNLGRSPERPAEPQARALHRDDMRDIIGQMAIKMGVRKLRRWRFRLKLAGLLVRLAARICWMDAEKSEVVEV